MIGWESTPIAFYFFGLLLSQALVLTASLVALRRLALDLQPVTKIALAWVLVGIGAAFTWTALVA